MIINNSFYLILGPMWSYKTTTLLHFKEKRISEGKQCIVFAPEGTQREDRPFLKNAISVKWIDNSEKNEKEEGTLPLIVSLKDFKEKLSKYTLDKNTWIFIDELQFFEEEIVDYLKELLDVCNIAAAGLAISYTTRLFPTPKKAAKFATKVIFKKADCWYCTQPTEYYEKIPGKTDGIKGTGVGGLDSYLPACFSCLHIESKKNVW